MSTTDHGLLAVHSPLRRQVYVRSTAVSDSDSSECDSVDAVPPLIHCQQCSSTHWNAETNETSSPTMVRRQSRAVVEKNHTLVYPDALVKDASCNHSARLRLAASRGEVALVGELLRAGTRLDTDRSGQHAIHFAALNGHPQILRLLLDAGTDVNMRDKLGYTAIHRAAAQGHLRSVHALITCGADVSKQDNVYGNTALHEAAWNGYSQTVDMLCRAGCDCTAANKANFTALHLASQNGHNQSVRVLLFAGCDPNAKNNYGDTALHTAARYGHAGVTRILISAGAITRINEVNRNADTPLHIAAALKRRKITKLLVEAGADTRLINKQREMAVDVARRKHHREILDMMHFTSTTTSTSTSNSSSFPIQPYVSPEPASTNLAALATTQLTSSFISDGRAACAAENAQTNNDESKAATNNHVEVMQMDISKKKVEQKKDKRRKGGGFFSLFRKKHGEPKSSALQAPVKSACSLPVPRDNSSIVKQTPGEYCASFSAAFTTCTCGVARGPCVDHGYMEYHGQLNHKASLRAETALCTTGAGGTVREAPVAGRLVRSRSDESLSISEHKMKIQEERARLHFKREMKAIHTMSPADDPPPVLGRRAIQYNEWRTASNHPSHLPGAIRLMGGAAQPPQCAQKQKSFSTQEHTRILIAAAQHRAAAQQLQDWYAQISEASHVQPPLMSTDV